MKLDRQISGTVLIPTLLYQAAHTMGNTFIPIYARSLGASMALAAFVTALVFLGQALADLPGGWLVHRFGDRKMMLTGLILSIAALVLRLLVPTMATLVASVILFGVGSSFIWISRMSWLKKNVRGENRGYTMSFVGGSLRMANIIGPLAGGFIAEHWGYDVLFSSQGILCIATLMVVVVAMPNTQSGNESNYRESMNLARKTWKENRGTILAAGIGIAGLTVLRSSREILFPLFGSEIGLSESLIGIVVFMGAVADASLFWLSGLIMTRMGRKAAAVACTVGLALGVGLLPMAGSMAVLAALSVLAGVGNAIGAGINLTISGDLAPRKAPTAFLSTWRFIMGFAGFGGPALASLVITSVGNSAAPPAVGALGLAGALIMAVYMKETRSPLRVGKEKI